MLFNFQTVPPRNYRFERRGEANVDSVNVSEKYAIVTCNYRTLNNSYIQLVVQ